MAFFDIEYSIDGTVYTKAATINATGNSNAEKNYSYQFLMQPARNYFFRLKMIERDGSLTYSPVSAKTNCGNIVSGISITPNPAKDRVTVSGLPPGKNTLMLYSIKGQLLKTIYSFTNNALIDLSKYAAGIYLLRIIDRNGNWTNEKIVKD